MSEKVKDPALCKQLEDKAKDEITFLNAAQIKYAYRGIFEDCAVAGKVFYDFIESQVEKAVLYFKFSKDQVSKYRKEVDRKMLYIYKNYRPGDGRITKSLFHQLIWKQAPHEIFSNVAARETNTYEENLDDVEEVKGVITNVSDRNSESAYDGICREQRTSMVKVISNLKKEDQKIIYWRFWEGWTLQEIGKKIGKAHNTILKRLNKILPELGDKFIEIDSRKDELVAA